MQNIPRIYFGNFSNDKLNGTGTRIQHFPDTIITTICNWKNDTADGEVMVSDKATFYLKCTCNEGIVTNILEWWGKCTSLTSSCFSRNRNKEMAFFYDTTNKHINLHKTVPEEKLLFWTEPTTKNLQTIDPYDEHQMASINFKTDYQNSILWPHKMKNYFSKR